LRVAVIVNPAAGRSATLQRVRRRAEQAADLLTSAGVEPDILITEHVGHAVDLASGAVARGARIVVAWGGDGTVNEVASALAFGPCALAIVPAGSGNGLARLFDLPAAPAAAFDRLLHGQDRQIDLGEANGRLFANVAGVGFDAHVAEQFAGLARSRRGLLRYAGVVARELWRYRSATYDLTLDGVPSGRRRAFLLSFANGRQWGNGAVIAPAAEPDDGWLDVVRVEADGPLAVCRSVPRLFMGTVDRAPGVSIHRAREVRLIAPGPLTFHVDGEPVTAPGQIHLRVRPGALRIRL
jgi:diacylglycerol kinase (ATP)